MVIVFENMNAFMYMLYLLHLNPKNNMLLILTLACHFPCEYIGALILYKKSVHSFGNFSLQFVQSSVEDLVVYSTVMFWRLYHEKYCNLLETLPCRSQSRKIQGLDGRH